METESSRTGETGDFLHLHVPTELFELPAFNVSMEPGHKRIAGVNSCNGKFLVKMLNAAESLQLFKS